MKKILFLSALIVSLNSFGQYVVNQSLGSDSTLVTSKGGLKSRIINKVFTDTTQANTQRIKFYDGSQIITITGGNKFWIRDSTLNKWIRVGETPTLEATLIAQGATPLTQGHTIDGNSRNITITGNSATLGNLFHLSGKSFRVSYVGPFGNVFGSIFAGSASTLIGNDSVDVSYTQWAHGWIYNVARDSFTVAAGVKGDRTTYLAMYPHQFYAATDGPMLLGAGTYADQYAVDSVIWRLENRDASLTFNSDGWHAYQTLGEYYFYNVARETDTTGLDLLVWDRADEEMKRIPSDLIGGVGGSQGLQDVITVDPVLTATNTITGTRLLQLNTDTVVIGQNGHDITVNQDDGTMLLESVNDLHLTFGGDLDIDGLQSSIDTTTYKPFAISTGGITRRMNSWAQVSGGGGSGVTTMAAIGATPNANGATISGSTLNLQPASASFGGVVTTGAQTWAGIKTHNAQDIFAGGLTIRGQYTANEGMMLQHDLTGGTGSNGLGEIVVYDGDFRSFKIRALDLNFAPGGTTAMFINSTAVTASVPITLKGYTVATLPAGVVGMTAYVTDATAPTYLATVVGGGAVVCPVFYNGSAWVSH